MRLPPWLYRLFPYLGRRQAEEDLQEELRLHLEMERERHRDAGVPEDKTLRAARQTLGNTTLIRERTRDVWGWRWLDDLGRDVRHAVRGLGRSPGFAATVVLVLALGIGANSAMFGIVHGMLIRPLPYPDSEAIVQVGEPQRGIPGAPLYMSNSTMPHVVEEAESFEQLAAYRESSADWDGPDGAVTLTGASVSPALFPLLRARPHLGRLFTEEEARMGADRVVLLSHRAWTTRFGADSDVVGSVVTLYDTPHTVVGVLEEGFYFPNPDGEFWEPLVMPPFTPPQQEGVGFVVLTFPTLGRLRDGVSPERAATEVRTILQRNDDGITRRAIQRGDTAGDTPEIEVRVVPLQDELVAGYRPALLALTAATLLVLLIACINVAGLLLARGVARRRALAVCAALGAGRGRLLRQLLTESVLLSVGGGALGLAAATTVLRAAPALVPGDIARLHEVSVDGVVLAFTLGLSVAVGLLFGAAPAWQWFRRPLVHALNEGGAQSAGGFRLLRSSRTRSLLATSQVALALLLLVGAGLLLRSFVGLITVERGYDPANVVAARISNPALGFPVSGLTPEIMAELRTASLRFSEALLDGTERLASLPGVSAIGLSSGLPLASSNRSTAAVSVDGRPPPSDPSELPQAGLQLTSPGYFDVMRLRLRRGRLYSRLDAAGSPRVVVVNETFARALFGGEPAIGQRVRFRAGRDGGDEPWEVIGVVADIRYEGLTFTDPTPEAFFSTHQIEEAPAFSYFGPAFIAARTAGDPLAVIPFLQEAVTEAHPQASLDQVMTMDARLSSVVAQPRFYAAFVGFFAALAVFLAAFGVYGLLSYTVAQRQAEIAIRMALGAQRGDVLALVVSQGAVLVGAGAVLGLAAAAASSRILESFLYGVATGDILTFIGAPVVLVAVALVACWLPARRATRVEPMRTLRFE